MYIDILYRTKLIVPVEIGDSDVSDFIGTPSLNTCVTSLRNEDVL
jgi:hypothetical protein